MREVPAAAVTKTVAKLCMDANYYISNDIKCAFLEAREIETEQLSQDIFNKLLQNAEIAAKKTIPICQDTGMAVVFIEIGQEVQITGGSLAEAIDDGVAQGYTKGYLRKSVVADPIRRTNTNDNTPAVIYYQIIAGDELKITVAPKGFGSENMSGLKMLKPSDGIEGVKAFIIDTVRQAGPNPCPPIIVGVGIGGTMEKAALLSKQGLLREVGSEHPDQYWNAIEKELLEELNRLNIGPAGLGGVTTALAVHINTFATHIAGLPVAVNIGCHVTRHATAML